MNRKSYARVSQSPGKTQTINYYNINDELYLVDLPGYGYAKTTRQTKEQWGALVERYLYSSETLKIVFLLIDIRHEPSANDKMMYEWIAARGYEPVIIATKLDKIARTQVSKYLKQIREGLGLKKDTVMRSDFLHSEPFLIVRNVKIKKRREQNHVSAGRAILLTKQLGEA